MRPVRRHAGGLLNCCCGDAAVLHRLPFLDVRVVAANVNRLMEVLMVVAVTVVVLMVGTSMLILMYVDGHILLQSRL